VALAALALLAVVFLSYLHRLYGVRNPAHGDQAAYLELAYNIRAGRGFVTRGLSPFQPDPRIEHPESVRAPIYPLLLSLVADQTPAFFLRAKFLTLGVSVLVLLVSFLVLWRAAGTLPALVFLLLLAHIRPFETFATEVWCENLLLVFCIPALFVIPACLTGRVRDPLRTGAAAGVLLGLGYLTKVSAAGILACWGLLVAGLLVGRRTTWISAPVRSAAAALAGFALTIVPYLLWNRFTIGRFFRDIDLRGAFWLDDGRQYWLPHDRIPGLASYLESHTLADALARVAGGLWRQGSNLVESIAAPCPSGEILGLLLLPAALVGLAACASPRWRAFQILFLAVTLTLAAWYAPIDVTPRFIYLLVPLILANAVSGLVFLASRMATAPGHLGGSRALAAIGLLLFLDLFRLVRPLEGGGYQLSPPERDTIAAIRRHVPPEAVLCIGPSHRLPYPWLIDRKTVFLPDFTAWDQVEAYFARFEVRAFLLDQEIYFRRPRLLADYAAFSPGRGLWIRQNLPGMAPVFANSGPFGEFFLFLGDTS